MTKKDYELLARIMYQTKPEEEENARSDSPCTYQWKRILEQMVFELSMDNPRFDAKKFRNTANQIFE